VRTARSHAAKDRSTLEVLFIKEVNEWIKFGGAEEAKCKNIP
jgi:hypothetical protein